MANAGLAFLVLVSIALMSPAAGQQETAEERKINGLKNLSQGIEKFSYSLLFRNFLELEGKSVVISPFSVWSMMAVLSEGAGVSNTRDELLAALGYHPTKAPTELGTLYARLSPYFLVKTSTVELETTNSIFYNGNFRINPNYIKSVGTNYDTTLTGLDFSAPNAASTINNAVYQATRGKIDEIVNSNDLKDSVMILTNAIFFKGQWTRPFNASETSLAPFYDEQSREVGKVNMMFQRSALPYANMQTFKAHVVELPYGQPSCVSYVDGPEICPSSSNLNQGGAKEENRLSMVVILPHRGVSLKEVMQLSVKVPVATIFASLKEAAEQYEDDEVDIYLPRFSVTSDILLNKVLTEMGIHELFDPQYADLSKMSPNSRNLHLSRVIHKATIEVTEQGTVATAVTAGELSNRNTPPKFLANRPFMYLLVEKSTNVVLFGGNYIQPSIF